MSLTKVSFSMIQGLVSNVLDFGALGNGITDDTSAIQAAITSCTNNGSTLFVPSGTYLFSAQLVFTCNLIGESNKTTIFQATGGALSTTEYAMCIGANSTITRRIQASNFFLRGDGSATLNNGLRFNAVWFSRFQSIRVTNFSGVGVKVSQESYWNTFEDLEAGRDSVSSSVTPSTGLYLAGVNAGGVTASTFTSCYFSGTTYGVNMSYGDNLVFNNLEVSGAPIGVNCPSSNSNIIINALYAEECATACIQGGSSSFIVNGLSDTASTTPWVTASPTVFMHRAGIPTKSWAIQAPDLTSSAITQYDDDVDWGVTYYTTRYGSQRQEFRESVMIFDAKLSSVLTPQAYHQMRKTSDTGELTFVINDDYSGNFAAFYNARGGVNISGANAADACEKLGKASTNRSLNAAGTLNASGADYAEYMVKAGDFEIAKGEICGINAEGKLTNKFEDAVSFVVKSTNPSYVGGDTWASEEIVGPAPIEPVLLSGNEEEVKTKNVELQKQYQQQREIFNAKIEIERKKVDRIAFAGQVPVNVKNAKPGDFIVPQNANGQIMGLATSNPTFEQYLQAVGKVIALEPDGRARIIVKVA